jgi:hypothetical protein
VGRTDDEKANLSKMMVKRLAMMFPGVEHIGMNVTEVNEAGYCSLAMIQGPKEVKPAANLEEPKNEKNAGEPTKTAQAKDKTQIRE